MKRKPTDQYPCDLHISKADLHTIKKTNWIDGFLWGSLVGGLTALFLCLVIDQIF